MYRLKDELLTYYLLFLKKEAEKILEYIPRRLGEYTLHSIDHSEAVIQNIHSLLDVATSISLNEIEKFLLYVSAFYHDIGNVVDRISHEELSTKILKDIASSFNVSHGLIELANEIISVHRRDDSEDKNINNVKETVPFHEEDVRLRLLCALFRFADALDIKESRAPEVVFKIFRKYVFDSNNAEHIISMRNWEAHLSINSYRIDSERKAVIVYYYKNRFENARLLIEELTLELESIVDVFLKYEIPILTIASEEYSLKKHG